MGAFGGGSTVEKMMSGTRPLPQAHLDNLQVYGRLDTGLIITIWQQLELVNLKWHKWATKVITYICLEPGPLGRKRQKTLVFAKIEKLPYLKRLSELIKPVYVYSV